MDAVCGNVLAKYVTVPLPSASVLGVRHSKKGFWGVLSVKYFKIFL